MKTDLNGCSTCPIGQEQYEFYTIQGFGRQVQYDYRTKNGFFSCVAPTLTIARKKRDRWLSKKAGAK